MSLIHHDYLSTYRLSIKPSMLEGAYTILISGQLAKIMSNELMCKVGITLFELFS